MLSFVYNQFRSAAPYSADFTFTLNGEPIKIDECLKTVGNISLNQYIRLNRGATGTKFMCLEGGCGCCTVSIRRPHPVTREWRQMTVNSCLFPLLACDNCEVETIEGLRAPDGTPHILSQRLAACGGSQCGYCSPGMVMNMHSLLAKRGAVGVTMDEVEQEFGGNICRCTGYRPILDAFKSFAIDFPPVPPAPAEASACALKDIEDMTKCYASCPGKAECHSTRKKFEDAQTKWYRPTNLEDVFQILAEVKDGEYMLLGGNTEHGIYRRSPDIEEFIEINHVEELKSSGGDGADEGLWVGGGFTFSELLELLRKKCEEPGFGYFKPLADHIEQIGSTSIRDMGTLGGNLMVKHDHPEFYSDLFLLLSAINAKLTINTAADESKMYSMEEFLDLHMNRKVITKITFPALDDRTHILRSYKITNRAQNGTTLINAAFLYQFDVDENVVDFHKLISISIAYGGINPKFTRATRTEESLKYQDIFDNEVLQATVRKLEMELRPDWVLPDPPPEFRQQLAINLFYKSVLNIAPVEVPRRNRSGAVLLQRPVSMGNQIAYPNKERFPLTKPMPKFEAYEQTSGYLQYTNDLQDTPDDLWCAFVHAKMVNKSFRSADPQAALELDGVVAFFDASHIPGKNTFVLPPTILIREDERIFLQPGTRVLYHNQPVGLIVATSADVARRAACLVVVKYDDYVEGGVQGFIDFPTAIESKDPDRLIVFNEAVDKVGKEAELEPADGLITVESTYNLGTQYHFSMEIFTTVCAPLGQDQMSVQTSTHGTLNLQTCLAAMLELPMTRFIIEVPPVGGGFGAKLTRDDHYACACGLACHLLRRKVRFIPTIEEAMSVSGKRMGTRSSYKLQTDDTGYIYNLFNDYYSDCGHSVNEVWYFKAPIAFRSGYDADHYQLRLTAARTNTPSNTHFRGPYDFEPKAMIENIMEHVAYCTQLDPAQVRLRNIPQSSPMATIYKTLLKTRQYYERKAAIDEFNRENRWKKKGIASMAMSFKLVALGPLTAIVTINAPDGTVLVAHGGIEIGQGVNTKGGQMAASILEIPLELVSVTNAGLASSAGASVTNLQTAYVVRKACEILNCRLAPIKKMMPGAEWKDITLAALEQGVDLSARYRMTVEEFEEHNAYGAGITEIEMDVLTGNVIIRRVDILQDTGESMNPLIDIGQVEGAFTMGIGFWLTEDILHHPKTGELLTNRTWNYKPPMARDIPVDFRVELLKNYGNPDLVVSAKGIGEPPLCLAFTIQPAIRYALMSARRDAGLEDKWLIIPVPCSPANILLLAGTDNSHLTI